MNLHIQKAGRDGSRILINQRKKDKFGMHPSDDDIRIQTHTHLYRSRFNNPNQVAKMIRYNVEHRRIPLINHQDFKACTKDENYIWILKSHIRVAREHSEYQLRLMRYLQDKNDKQRYHDKHYFLSRT